MIEIMHKVSGRRVRVPLAGPANRQGRIAASNALGMDMRYRGALGTSAVKIFEATAAMTGLSERAAREAGFAVGVAVIHKGHHAGYYPGAEELSLKLVYDRKTARLLGAQAFGRGRRRQAHRRARHRAGRQAHAPRSGRARPRLRPALLDGQRPDQPGRVHRPQRHLGIQSTGVGGRAQGRAGQARTAARAGRSNPRRIRGSRISWAPCIIPVDDLRFELDRLPKDRRIVVHCRSGFRAHLAVRILKQRGFADVANVTGGYLSMLAEGGFNWETT